MQDEINNKLQQISAILTDIDNVLNVIESCYLVINSLKNNPELQVIYAQETLPFIDDYRNLRKELIALLKDYFELEKKVNAPRKLYLRSLYKGLMKQNLVRLEK